MRLPLGFLLCAHLAAGCADDAAPPAAPGTSGGPSAILSTGGASGAGDGGPGEGGLDGAAGDVQCERLDLLLVVDNSSSTAEEREALSARAGAILDVLEGGDPPLDYQLAVAHSAWSTPTLYGFVSQGVEGALLQTAGMAQPWLTRDDPSAEEQLAELLLAGGEERDDDAYLQVARAAVTSRIGAGQPNTGFLRDEAHLGVLVVADSDDGSLDGGGQREIDDALADFDAVKGGREGWSAGFVAGARDPRCVSDAFGEASYAAGLDAFAEAAGDNARLASLCAGDLSSPLGTALGTVLRSCALQQAGEADP